VVKVPGLRYTSRYFTDSNSIQVLLDLLAPEAEMLIQASISFNTRSTYQTGFQDFDKFRSELHLPLTWPPSFSDIINFIAQLSKKSLAPSTVKCYLSAISFQSKLSGYIDNTQHVIVK